MADSQDIINALASNLAQPKRARTEAGEVEQHDLIEQVAAAKFALQMLSVKSSPFGALRFAQVVPPNASNSSDPTAQSDVYPPPGLGGLPGYGPYF